MLICLVVSSRQHLIFLGWLKKAVDCFIETRYLIIQCASYDNMNTSFKSRFQFLSCCCRLRNVVLVKSECFTKDNIFPICAFKLTIFKWLIETKKAKCFCQPPSRNRLVTKFYKSDIRQSRFHKKHKML